jgi:hypothetical protein
MVYTTRFAGGRGGRNHLEYQLRRLNIVNRPRFRDWPEATRGWLLCQRRGSIPKSCASGRCGLCRRPVSRMRSCR